MVEATVFVGEAEARLARLYQIAYGILRTRQDAEDAVQQALLKAWAARSGAKAETLGPWLARIVVNECRNIQRHRMRVVPTERVAKESEAFSPPDPDLWAAVQALPETLRLPIIMKYAARFTELEVARAMGLPVSTIKNRLAKGRKVLRKALAEWEVSFE